MTLLLLLMLFIEATHCKLAAHMYILKNLKCGIKTSNTSYNLSQPIALCTCPILCYVCECVPECPYVSVSLSVHVCEFVPECACVRVSLSVRV